MCQGGTGKEILSFSIEKPGGGICPRKKKIAWPVTAGRKAAVAQRGALLGQCGRGPGSPRARLLGWGRLAASAVVFWLQSGENLLSS